jgi:hypothetical protein
MSPAMIALWGGADHRDSLWFKKEIHKLSFLLESKTFSIINLSLNKRKDEIDKLKNCW